MNALGMSGSPDPVEAYRRQEKALEESCHRFEGLFLSMIWKEMMAHARTLGAGEKRTYAPLEDTAVEMASEELSLSGGAGLWRVLYDQLHAALGPDPSKRAAEGRGTDEGSESVDGASDGERGSLRDLRPSSGGRRTGRPG
jgi:Rod binding domain-containing protein